MHDDRHGIVRSDVKLTEKPAQADAKPAERTERIDQRRRPVQSREKPPAVAVRLPRGKSNFHHERQAGPIIHVGNPSVLGRGVHASIRLQPGAEMRFAKHAERGRLYRHRGGPHGHQEVLDGRPVHVTVLDQLPQRHAGQSERPEQCLLFRRSRETSEHRDQLPHGSTQPPVGVGKPRCLQGVAQSLVLAIWHVATLVTSVWNHDTAWFGRMPGRTITHRWVPRIRLHAPAEGTLATGC